MANPLSAIEYAQWVLSNNSDTIINTPQTLDNSDSYWVTGNPNGNTFFYYVDSSTNTLTFVHTSYVGPEQNGSMDATDMHPEVLNALGISADSGGWDLIFLGIGLIAAGVLIDFVTCGFTLGIACIGATLLTKALYVVGAGAIIAGITDVWLTPTVVSTTCNTSGTSCVTQYTSPAGAFNTTVNCTNSTSACTSATTQPVGGLGSILGELEYVIIIGVIIVVVILILYVVTKYVVHKEQKPAPTPPARAT